MEDNQFKIITDQIEALSTIFQTKFDELRAGLHSVNSRLDSMDNKLTVIDSRLFTIEANIEKISEWTPFRTPPLVFAK